MKSTMKPLEMIILGVAVVAFLSGIVITIWSSHDAKRGADVYSKLVAPAGSASAEDVKRNAAGPREAESRSRRPGPPQSAPSQTAPVPQMKAVRGESPFGAAADVQNGENAASSAGIIPKKASMPDFASEGTAISAEALRVIDLNNIKSGGSGGNVIRITGPDGNEIEATVITAPLDGLTIERSAGGDRNAGAGATVRVEIKKE